jgi:hypothetical protein
MAQHRLQRDGGAGSVKLDERIDAAYSGRILFLGALATLIE